MSTQPLDHGILSGIRRTSTPRQRRHDDLADTTRSRRRHPKGQLKPREVTTVEELEALPVGSVVLHGFRTFQHYPAYPAPFDEYQKWKCPDGGFVRSTKDGTAILPATVIYTPEEAE